MDFNKISQSVDYNLEINRHTLKHCGIGPRIQNRPPNQLWPRDAIEPERECCKVFYQDLRKSINCKDQIELIESIFKRFYDALKHCNVNNLFNKYCRLEYTCSIVNQFDVVEALEAYTQQNRILNLIHSVIRSLNKKHFKHEGDFVKVIFGSNRNMDIYKKHLTWLVRGNSRFDKLYLGQIVFNRDMAMDLNQIKWLDGIKHDIKCRIFLQLMGALTRFIMELLRRYFYTTVSNPYVYKLFYYRYDLWRHIQTKVIRVYLSKGILSRFLIDRTSSLSLSDMSKMRFHLKKDDVRMICSSYRPNYEAYEIHQQLHTILSYVADTMANNQRFKLHYLQDGLKNFKYMADNENKPIYIVRADLKDCYQSVIQEKLRLIILDLVKNHLVESRLRLIKVRCVSNRRNGSSATNPRELHRWTMDIDQLGEPFKGYDGDAHVDQIKFIEFEEFDRKYLSPQIIKPVIRGSKSSKYGYNLMSGLRQGSKSSPLLCSIYIQQAFNTHLSELYNSPNCKVFRYVDDILFLATDLSKARRFLKQMLDGFEDFNLKCNVNKLACNFRELDHLGHHQQDRVSLLDGFVVFYKRKLSLDSLRCQYHFDYQDVSIDNTFLVNPYLNETNLKRQVSRLIHLESIHLDSNLNGIKQVVVNIFENALLIAHRIGTLLMVSFFYRNLNNQQPTLLMRIIKKISRRMDKFNRLYIARQREISESQEALGVMIDESDQLNGLIYAEIHLIVFAAFRCTWSQIKLRHRRKELDMLMKRFRRSKMKYLVSVREEDGELSGVEFENCLYKLIKEFPSSCFAREVQLPNKTTD